MSVSSAELEASTGWFGQLSQIPLFAVLRRIQRERLTGTLTVSREDQSSRFLFQNGELRTANSSREEHRIGTYLVRWGYLSETELQQALAAQREGQARLDQILVEKGLITRAVLDTEARRLMEQIVFSTLSWREGDFYFVSNTGVLDSDVAFSLSATEIIMEGIRRIPESEQFVALLGNLSSVPVCAENRAPESPILHLPSEALYYLSRIDGKTDALTLLSLGPGSRMAGAKILYALIYCGLVEMREPAQPSPEEEKTAAESPSPPAKLPETSPANQFIEEEHRDLVRNVYRRIDWLSHYDLLGVSTNATPKEIEEAHHARANLFDPALQQRPYLADCTHELHVLSERLRAAREILANPLSREAYDRKILEAQAFVAGGSPQATAPDEQAAARSAKIRQWTASQNFQRAKELIEAHDFFPAIQMLSEAVHFAPRNAEYRYRLGLVLLKNRLRRESAIEHLKEAARLDPARAEIQASLATAYFEQGAYYMALPFVCRARELDPENAIYRELEESIKRKTSERPAAEKTGSFARPGSKRR